ncbi:MAG: ribonuclease P protein component [Clostridia bacterium]
MQKQYRLSGSKTFNYIYKKGSSVATRQLVLISAPSKFTLRVGVVVSKKVGNAVTRNKVRRRIKEAFRALIPLVEDKCNYIIVARTGIDACNFRQINDSLVTALKRANKLKKSINGLA